MCALQDNNICGVQCVYRPDQDRDVGEAALVHQLDFWLLQDDDATSRRQARKPTSSESARSAECLRVPDRESCHARLTAASRGTTRAMYVSVMSREVTLMTSSTPAHHHRIWACMLSETVFTVRVPCLQVSAAHQRGAVDVRPVWACGPDALGPGGCAGADRSRAAAAPAPADQERAGREAGFHH